MIADLKRGYTRLLIEKCAMYGLSLEQAAYVLGTAYHESGHTMRPVRETMASSTDAAIRILDREWEDPGSIYYKHRGTVRSPYWRRDADGKSWLGRGLTQLTLKGNYENWTRILGVDLVSDPEKVMDPDIGATILVRGMKEGRFRKGHKLARYINKDAVDYLGARKTVNGYIPGVAQTIAEYAQAYEGLLREIGYGPMKRRPNDSPKGKGAGGVVAAVIAALVALAVWGRDWISNVFGG